MMHEPGEFLAHIARQNSQIDRERLMPPRDYAPDHGNPLDSLFDDYRRWLWHGLTNGSFAVLIAGGFVAGLMTAAVIVGGML